MKQSLTTATATILLILFATTKSFAGYSGNPGYIEYDQELQMFYVLMQNTGTLFVQTANELNTDSGKVFNGLGYDVGISKENMNTAKYLTASENQVWSEEEKNIVKIGNSTIPDFRRLTVGESKEGELGGCFLLDTRSNSIVKVYYQDSGDKIYNDVPGYILPINDPLVENPIDLCSSSGYLYVLCERNDDSAYTKIYKFDFDTYETSVVYSTPQIGSSSISVASDGRIFVAFAGTGGETPDGSILMISFDGDTTLIANNLSSPSDVKFISGYNAVVFTLPTLSKIGIKLLEKPITPTLTTPLSGDEIDSYIVDFSWSYVFGDQILYDFLISESANFQDTLRSFECKKNNISGLMLEPLKDYYWKVRAKSGENVGEWSETFSFKTGEASYSSPILLTPQGNAINMPAHLNFSWKSAGAEFYEFQLSKSNDFSDLKEYATYLHDTTYTNKTALSAGTVYFWRVRTYSSTENMSNWSETRKLSTKNSAPDAPQLYKPDYYSYNASRNPHLIWKPVDFCTAYRVSVSESIEFYDPLFLDTIVPEVAGNVFDTLQIHSLKLGTIYYWNVKSLDDKGDGNWSEIWAFTVIIRDSTVSDTTSPGSDTLYVPAKYISLPLYPQPADNYVILNTSGLTLSQQVDLEFFSSDGRLLFSRKDVPIPANNQIEIPLYELSRGTYLLRIGNDKKRFVGKLIKY